MKVIIVEDEPFSAEKLSRELVRLRPEVAILATLDSVKASVQWLLTHEAELIFLDIHLSDGISFQIFEQVTVKTPVIFTTAYDQYAIRAFRVNSLDYLLKPVKRSDLAQALEKFDDYQQAAGSLPPVDYEAVLAAIERPMPGYKSRFMVQVGSDKLQTIPIEEVAYFFGEGRYTFLVHRRGHQHLIDTTLERLTHELDPQHFFRINRQFIVGVHAIEQMFTWTKGRVKLMLNPPSDRETIVSVERSRDFKQWLDR